MAGASGFPIRLLEKILHEKIPQALLQFVDGTLLMNPRFFKKVYDGYGFVVSHRFESVSSDAQVQVLLENPSGSGRTVYLVLIEVVSTGQGHVNVHVNNTVSTSGTSLTPQNLRIGSSITPVANVEYGGSYTVGDTYQQTVLPGGSGVRAVGSIYGLGESVIIPEGNNILVTVTNKSSSSEDFSVKILWWEE